MALSGMCRTQFHGSTQQMPPEVRPVQKILAILLSLFATMVIVGIVLVITRTGSSWPRSIRAIDWRRLTGTSDDESVSEEAPARE